MEGSTAMYTTLDNLSESDFKRFREYLSRDFKKGFKPIPWGKLEKADVTDTVRLMRNSYGDQGSSELTRDILETMGCLGIASRLSGGTQNVEDLARGHSETEIMEGSTAMYTTLDNLSESDFKRFREYLSRDVKEGFKPIPWGKLEKADVTDTVRLMRNSYGDQGSSELTRDILETMGCLGISEQMTTKTGTTADVTDKQLMKLAKCMGGEWKQVAIGYLGVPKEELERIQESEQNVVMQRYCMLDKWRRQNKGKAGVRELHDCLNEDDVPNGVRDCLEPRPFGEVNSQMEAALVEEWRPELIQRVTAVMPIADQLLSQRFIGQETYAKIQAAATSQDKMRLLFDALRSAEARGKLALYTILQAEEPHLMKDLKNRHSATNHSEFDGAAKSAKMTTKTGTTADVTDKQLMKLAKCMGVEWKQVGICYLGLPKEELERIQESKQDVVMQRYCMLDKWRRQNKGKAGVRELHDCLNEDDVPNGVRDCLEVMLKNN
ncbi:uncharacterized protein LOC134453876 [Engraulis encrasicolus]|uniref:uncharacterized protein LOC134453876 n=1 Tax=Engraulis encrasicolus TaxID=184585 RepID=UPI002FD1D054